MPKVAQRDIKSLPPLERFLYWIRERYNIWKKRTAGQPYPWTTDPVLSNYFFTMPYRELDKTTVWFREKIRDPMKNDPGVAFATIAFRWFNFIPTGEILIKHHLLTEWDTERCVSALQDEVKIFTGAYMISSPQGESKLRGICNRLQMVWEDREQLVKDISPEHPTRNDPGASCSMKYVHERLMKYEGMGGFMAYEVVCDLRYTHFLRGAPDTMTWCNPGPGAIRGMYRMLKIPFPTGKNSGSLKVPSNWETETQKLLKVLNAQLKGMPPFEMREVEHSLCEWDKYERLLHNDGRSKRVFRPTAPKIETESLKGLRRPQIAILRTLIESDQPMTRKQIAQVSGVDQSKIGDYAGPRPDNQSEKTKTRWQFPTLIELGYVVAPECDIDGYDMFLYQLTPKGRKLRG